MSHFGYSYSLKFGLWRQQQLQESPRNSVLDEEAAAKFSTAAALAAKALRRHCWPASAAKTKSNVPKPPSCCPYNNHPMLAVLQELSQWRQQQLQESLRNSVLDEEAAAKFSTAAALAAKEKRNQMAKANYDKGLLTAVDTVEAFQEVCSKVNSHCLAFKYTYHNRPIIQLSFECCRAPALLPVLSETVK